VHNRLSVLPTAAHSGSFSKSRDLFALAATIGPGAQLEESRVHDLITETSILAEILYGSLKGLSQHLTF
jgi:hypothetical protein